MNYKLCVCVYIYTSWAWRDLFCLFFLIFGVVLEVKGLFLHKVVSGVLTFFW